MSNKIDRRQLGKSLLAGAALIAAGKPASAQQDPAPEPLHSTRWSSIAPGIWKATIGTPEELTPVSTRLVKAKLDVLNSLAVVPAPPIAAPVGKIRRRGTSLAFPLHPNEELYGFGLQMFSLSHRSKKVVLRVNADPKIDSGDSHAPVPYYVSSRGYGLFVDTARYATFYCGEARDKPSQPEQTTVSSTTPLYERDLNPEDSSRILVDIPAAQGVDVYLFAGPSMLDAVRRYNLFSGGGPTPPEWGLGFWYRAHSETTDKQILSLATEFREHKIPCDVIGLEPGWQSHAYPCSFAWNKSRFPQPEGLINQLKDKSYHVNLWEHAFISPASAIFPAMSTLSGDKGVWGGLVPDFQDPRARKIFGEYHGKELVDIGISGFKLDECDNSDYTGGWSFPEASQFPSGVDGEQMHSLFGLRYQQTLWQQFLDRNQPTYSLVRSSGALATAYPFVLYSDLYDHRQFVRALVNSGFSGLLWCPEVRDAKSEEDLIRRLQTVVFSPLAMVNAWYIANPPWKQLDRKKNNANDLMPNWKNMEARCREIIGWRMQLVPYLRAAFARYAADGTPPFRALTLDWPDVPEIAKVDDAWMIGDRMLVAPLFAGEAHRTVTLPPGDWHNYWTGKQYTGGTTLEVPANTLNIPVFVKTGSVLPLATIANSTADLKSRKIDVAVFGDGHLPFSMATPDGDLLQLSWNAATHSGSVEQKGKNQYTITGWSSASNRS
jgi:alpha-D-xyloside xylohydrolase